MISIFEPQHYSHHQELLKIGERKPVSELSNIEPQLTHEAIENDEREVIEVFINRMNDLDDERGDFSRALEEEEELADRHSGLFQYQSGMPQIKERCDSEYHLTNSPMLNERIGRDTQFRHLVSQKTREIEFQLSALQIQKFQIVDQLLTFKQQSMALFSKKGEQWQKVLEKLCEQTQKKVSFYESKLQAAEQQLSKYAQKHSYLIEQRELQGQDSNHLQTTLQQLQQTNHRLNSQLQHLQCQNSEIKYQLRQNIECQSTMRQLQQQIRQLSRTIDQNSEYIFDLQQRVASESLQLAEKEGLMRREMELRLGEEREELERQYKAEFQRIREDLELQMRSQIMAEVQNSLESAKLQHDRELQRLKLHYEQGRQMANSEQRKLENQLMQYEQKASQLTGYNQLSKNIQTLKSRLKQKQMELGYYKQKAAKLQRLPEPTKTNNILLIEQLSHSYSKNAAISPCSRGTTKISSSSRDEMINNILTRIRMKQSHSILSNLNDTNLSIESLEGKMGKPVSPESMILEKEKDLRMKNISHKLEQLRSDIRREIGMISH